MAASALLRVVRFAARRPLAVLAAVGLLAALGALGASRLEPSVGTSTLVSDSDATAQATQRYHERFGDDAVLVLVREPLTDLLMTSDLGRLIGLEGCLGGNVPAGASVPGGPGSPCAAFARDKPIRAVYGPGTFASESANQITDELQRTGRQSQARADQADRAAVGIARAQGRSTAEAKRFGQQARALVGAQYVDQLKRAALQYGLTSPPQINDPRFVSQLFFDATRGYATPKARFAYLLPNPRAALVQIRLRADLSPTQRRRTLDLVRRATAMPDFHLQRGGTYTVTGAPVVLDLLSTSVTHAVVFLLVIAVLVMAFTLLFVFRSRRRLVPLFVAGLAAAITFGLMSLAGLSLTMASVAVLPVLIGLAVDYAIQFQSRFGEARAAGDPAPLAAEHAAARGAPTIATAGLATSVGFLVLLLSPVPMVRGFGLLLVLGVAIAFGCAVSAGTAALVLGRSEAPTRPLPGPIRALGAALRASWRGAGELVAPAVHVARRGGGRIAGPVTRGARASLRLALERPGRVLAIAAALAALGLVADTQTSVESDITKLVPQDTTGLRDLGALQRASGVAGEVDVTVEGDDLADPAVVRWMVGYQRDLLQRYGYSPKRGCGQAALCPGLSLPDLLRGPAAKLNRDQLRALLGAIPPYFSQALITPDRTMASLSFGVRLMPAADQQKVFDEMRDRLHPPPGVRAHLAGLPVLVAQANAAVSASWRRLLTLLVGLLAVGLVLFARPSLRGLPRDERLERALVPLVPIGLAAGWSSLTLFVLRIPLNPMSAVLGALVIAIATEFSVLLDGRYREERRAGHDVRTAVARAYRSTGAAVLASGATAVAGFAVLVLSDISMLRNFGIVTVVDLSVALLGVLVVLPAVLVLSERGELRTAPATALRRVAERLPRPRRRARAAA